MIVSVSYTSATGSGVSILDDAGRAWHDDASLPADTALRRELADWVAAGGVIAAYAAPPVDLRAYANNCQWALATGGYTATIDGVARTFPTDDVGRSLLAGAVVRLQQVGAPPSVNWQFGSDIVTLSASDVISAGIAVSDFVQATFDALAAVFAAIDGGTISTTAEIDAWAWPASSV